MDRLHGILVFLRVVEHGTLSGAARALGVSTAAVSGTLTRLEKQLAARLLIRTTRKIITTPEGEDFYARCKRITADLAEAEVVAGRSGTVVSGRLRVRLPLALGRMWIIPRLPAFMQAYPALGIEVVCMDYVPHSIDEGLDLSVQTGELQSSSLAVRRLAETHYVVCGVPSYYARHGKPQSPKDLAHHTCIAYRRPRNGRIREWRFLSGSGIRPLAITGLLIVNRIELLVEAALAGAGLIQIPVCYVQPHIDNGALLEVLHDHRVGGYHVSVVYRQQQRLAPKLRAFMDFLVNVFEPPPWRHIPSRGVPALAPRQRRRAQYR